MQCWWSGPTCCLCWSWSWSSSSTHRCHRAVCWKTSKDLCYSSLLSWSQWCAMALNVRFSRWYRYWWWSLLNNLHRVGLKPNLAVISKNAGPHISFRFYNTAYWAFYARECHVAPSSELLCDAVWHKSALVDQKIVCCCLAFSVCCGLLLWRHLFGWTYWTCLNPPLSLHQTYWTHSAQWSRTTKEDFLL